jgi:hypothetical protein
LRNFGIVTVVLFVSLCGINQATAGVIYQFSGTTVGVADLSQAFTAVLSDYVTQAIPPPGNCPGSGCVASSEVVPGTCVGCDPELFGGVETVAQLVPGYPAADPQSDYLGFFVNSSGVEYLYYFPLGSFADPGTYATIEPDGNVGTLIVSETPEPSTISCAFLALTGLIAFGRRTSPRQITTRFALNGDGLQVKRTRL